jgi:hypothetical protein
MQESTVAIHNVLKKKNYKAKFSISLILKKKSTETINKINKNTKKTGTKKSCWKTL